MYSTSGVYWKVLKSSCSRRTLTYVSTLLGLDLYIVLQSNHSFEQGRIISFENLDYKQYHMTIKHSFLKVPFVSLVSILRYFLLSSLLVLQGYQLIC